jgi:hypothetical protein
MRSYITFDHDQRTKFTEIYSIGLMPWDLPLSCVLHHPNAVIIIDHIIIDRGIDQKWHHLRDNSLPSTWVSSRMRNMP